MRWVCITPTPSPWLESCQKRISILTRQCSVPRDVKLVILSNFAELVLSQDVGAKSSSSVIFFNTPHTWEAEVVLLTLQTSCERSWLKQNTKKRHWEQACLMKENPRARLRIKRIVDFFFFFFNNFYKCLGFFFKTSYKASFKLKLFQTSAA